MGAAPSSNASPGRLGDPELLKKEIDKQRDPFKVLVLGGRVSGSRVVSALTFYITGTTDYQIDDPTAWGVTVPVENEGSKFELNFRVPYDGQRTPISKVEDKYDVLILCHPETATDQPRHAGIVDYKNLYDSRTVCVWTYSSTNKRKKKADPNWSADQLQFFKKHGRFPEGDQLLLFEFEDRWASRTDQLIPLIDLEQRKLLWEAQPRLCIGDCDQTVNKEAASLLLKMISEKLTTPKTLEAAILRSKKALYLFLYEKSPETIFDINLLASLVKSHWDKDAIDELFRIGSPVPRTEEDLIPVALFAVNHNLNNLLAACLQSKSASRVATAAITQLRTCSSLDTLKMLVEAGAKLNKCSPFVLSNFFPEGKIVHREMLDYLVDRGLKLRAQNGLLISCLLQHEDDTLDALTYLLEHGVHPDSGETPAYFRVRARDDKILYLLLKYGADVNAKQKGTGETVLHYWSREYRDARIMVYFLLSHGANPDHMGKNFLSSGTFMSVHQYAIVAAQKKCILLYSGNQTRESVLSWLPKEILKRIWKKVIEVRVPFANLSDVSASKLLWVYYLPDPCILNMIRKLIYLPRTITADGANRNHWDYKFIYGKVKIPFKIVLDRSHGFEQYFSLSITKKKLPIPPGKFELGRSEPHSSCKYGDTPEQNSVKGLDWFEKDLAPIFVPNMPKAYLSVLLMTLICLGAGPSFFDTISSMTANTILKPLMKDHAMEIHVLSAAWNECGNGFSSLQKTKTLWR